MMSSHLAAMRVLPDSARSLKIEMNIWDLTSVSKKSMQQKTAIVSNKDHAPFYHSFFLDALEYLNFAKQLESILLNPVSPQKTASKCHFLAEESPKS